MIRKRQRLVQRGGRGTFVLNLDEEQVGLLTHLAGQLDPVLDDPTVDAGLRRLFPPAHTEDLLAEAAWQIEQGSRLRDSRRRALEALARPGGTPLTEDELVQWMQGVNSLRLVLAERLMVDDDPDQEERAIEAAFAAAESPDPTEAMAGHQLLEAWSVYHHLSLMVNDAVDALGDPI